MNPPRLVIIDGVRTPFSKMGTDLARLGADELGRVATQALLTRTGIDPGLIDEVIFGCVGQPADAANVARVIALRAGIPERVPAITVHRNCASGMESFTQAYEKMCAGRGEIWDETCGRCAGLGHGVQRRRVDVVVPPGVREGMWMSFELTTQHMAATQVCLRVAIR